jgi:hypothetical protein
VLLVGCCLTALVYWPGLSGGFLFDDYPNIVDNEAVQPSRASLPLMVNAALSSPSSEFKRPLASLSFAANYVATGLNPYWMKLTNVVIHLLNGLLVFLFARNLLWVIEQKKHTQTLAAAAIADSTKHICTKAALIATAWMLLPINLTNVLYVIQRMESLANLFVLVGLLGYIAGRTHMLGLTPFVNASLSKPQTGGKPGTGLTLCILSITLPAAAGALAKETAIMLPLYAFLMEWLIFGFKTRAGTTDRRLVTLFVVLLLLPLIIGLTWLAPHVLNPASWSTRDFTLRTRLLSEARIVVSYIVWTFFPTPHALSFYHDNFHISTSLFAPWTTLTSILTLLALIVLAWQLRSRQPLVAIGIGFYLGCHLLTGTFLPLELVYEHRNYFASMGLMLALVPLLAVTRTIAGRYAFLIPRWTLLAGLLALWGGETAMTAIAWGNPLLLAETLAARAPDSPRAQYELGRTYIIYSHYDPTSRFTQLAYAPLERAAALPEASILPEQALIFMNARMNLPLKDAWWNSLIDKLKSRKPTIQDESSLGALTQCARTHDCDLPKQQMIKAYEAALSHPNPSARLLAMYSDYAWNILGDRELGLRMAEDAVQSSPNEPAYRITLIRMLVVLRQRNEIETQIEALERLNIGGRLGSTLAELKSLSTSQ